MKIVITGRDFSNKNHDAINLLRETGCEVNDFSEFNLSAGSNPELVAETIGDSDIVIAGLEPINKYVLDKCPNIKMISRRGIGYDSVDINECRRKGIVVAKTTGVVEGAVAEHVMAYILYNARKLHLQNKSMHEGKWERMMMLGAKTRVLGLVGFGGIGKEIAKRAKAFNMEILYYCRQPKDSYETEYGAHYATFDELLEKSDYVSVNVPLTVETTNMFTEKEFKKIKQGCFFINIVRSQVVDMESLKSALDSGHLSGAAVDVFEHEPCTDSLLHACENVILTPHTAPYTIENFLHMNLVSAQNAVDFINHNFNEYYRVI